MNMDGIPYGIIPQVNHMSLYDSIQTINESADHAKRTSCNTFALAAVESFLGTGKCEETDYNTARYRLAKLMNWNGCYSLEYDLAIEWLDEDMVLSYHIIDDSKDRVEVDPQSIEHSGIILPLQDQLTDFPTSKQCLVIERPNELSYSKSVENASNSIGISLLGNVLHTYRNPDYHVRFYPWYRD